MNTNMLAKTNTFINRVVISLMKKASSATLSEHVKPIPENKTF